MNIRRRRRRHCFLLYDLGLQLASVEQAESFDSPPSEAIIIYTLLYVNEEEEDRAKIGIIYHRGSDRTNSCHNGRVMFRQQRAPRADSDGKESEGNP